jgi:hypothetical protein
MLRSASSFVCVGLALLLSAPAYAKPKAKAVRVAAPAPAVNGSGNVAADGGSAAPEPATMPANNARPIPEKSEPAVLPKSEPAAETKPPEQPPNPEPAAADSGKLAELRADVAGLVDEMVEARTRVALLGKTLFKTQLRVKIQNLAAPDPVLGKVVLKLDGAPIYHGDGAALSGDDAHQVFQGFIAPGAHVLAAELEQSSKRDAAYGYSLHESYRFQVVRDKRSELTLIMDDDSDLADDFPDDAQGEYDVRMKLRVRTKNLNEE